MRQLYLITLLFLFSNTALGFGALGHRVISEIAENHLSENAKLEIARILEGESLASVSTWADVMRYSNEGSDFWSYKYSSSWHFVNIEKDSSYAQSDKNRQGDAYIALLSFVALLKQDEIKEDIIKQGLEVYLAETKPSRPQQASQQLALKFLIHLLADLHQPMHVGYKEDQGGNQIEVKWFKRKTNLHSVWDTHLLTFQNLDDSELEAMLNKRIKNMSAVEIQSLQTTDPLNWINEGLLLRDEIYAVDYSSITLNEDYALKYTPVINQQLIKAGLRLAAVLNQIFE